MKILNKICDRPIQLHSLARSARNFYYISFWKFFSNNIDPPPPGLSFFGSWEGKNLPPSFPLPPKHFGPPQAENFWGILEEILLFEKQKSRIFVLCKKYVFFITYSNNLLGNRSILRHHQFRRIWMTHHLILTCHHCNLFNKTLNHLPTFNHLV